MAQPLFQCYNKNKIIQGIKEFLSDDKNLIRLPRQYTNLNS